MGHRSLLDVFSWPIAEGSIFFFFVALPVMVFVVVESYRILRFFKNHPTKSERLKTLEKMVEDPRAPLGWSAVAALFLILLATVQWAEPGAVESKPRADVSATPIEPKAAHSEKTVARPNPKRL